MERKTGGSKFMANMALHGVLDPGYFYLGSLPSSTCSSHVIDQHSWPIFCYYSSMPVSKKEGRMAQLFHLRALSEFANTTSLWQKFSP